MTQITPNARFMQRLLPAILLEGVVLAAAVFLYVYTEQLFWIFVAVAAGVLFGLWVIVLLMRHRDEWRVTGRKVF